MKKSLFIPFILSSLFADSYIYQNGQRVELVELKDKRSATIRYFKNSQTKREVGVSQNLLISFKDGVDEKAILNQYNLVKIEDLNSFTTLAKANSIDEAIEICNALVEADLVNFAHPDFLKKIEKRDNPTDEFFAKQWHLVDTPEVVGANVEVLEAWKYTKGSGVKVAIFDDAVDTEHEDLKAGVVASLNVFDDSSDATAKISDNAHGTFVAGVAVARENGKGIVGVAPEASILAIKGATGDEATDSTTIKAFTWAKEQGVDVMNNSWGSYGVSDAVKSSIVDLATNGRDGKGVIIAFGSGNEGCSDKETCKDADGEEMGLLKYDEGSISEVLSVGATNHLNQRASYSNYGIYLDITAPGGDGDNITENNSGMVSTDISGEMGWSQEANNNYITNDINQVGTSYASPVVAGVSALILSANPDLTREQVFEILKTTSDKVGNYTYTDGKSNELGYGKINAKNAVLKAIELKGSSTTEPTPTPTSSTTFDYGFDSLQSGWHLLGAVEDLSNVQSQNSLESVWSFTDGSWSKNPTEIKEGKGFWIKK